MVPPRAHDHYIPPEGRDEELVAPIEARMKLRSDISVWDGRPRTLKFSTRPSRGSRMLSTKRPVHDQFAVSARLVRRLRRGASISCW